ncbi:MAG: hypothetical protein HY460_00515 [Parcubacteria group bacterium]|nr:hypothetical protein [Parcubacteria group bacterium]
MNVAIGILFLAFVFGYCVMGSILFFHWRTYAPPDTHLPAMRILFVVVSVALFVVAGILYFRIPWIELRAVRLAPDLSL